MPTPPRPPYPGQRPQTSCDDSTVVVAFYVNHQEFVVATTVNRGQLSGCNVSHFADGLVLPGGSGSCIVCPLVVRDRSFSSWLSSNKRQHSVVEWGHTSLSSVDQSQLRRTVRQESVLLGITRFLQENNNPNFKIPRDTLFFVFVLLCSTIIWHPNCLHGELTT